MEFPRTGTVRYEITRRAVGEPRFVEITKEDYERFRHASQYLADVLVLEEKLDLVLANYAEYETELLRLAVEQMVWPGHEWQSVRSAFYDVNRRILNLLASSRLYFDQLKHKLSAMYGTPSTEYTRLRQRERTEYASHLAYRAIDALRNYAQHRGMPAGRVWFPVRREEQDGTQLIRFMVIPYLDLTELRQDKKIKAAVLDDLDTNGTTNLSQLIRSYLDSIGRVHNELRSVTDSDVTNAEQSFDDARARAKPVFGQDLRGLAVVIRLDDGTVSDSADLAEEVYVGRRALREKNGVLVNFAQRYATNIIVPEK